VCACEQIACKYHEEIPPEMPELVEISAECYKAEDVRTAPDRSFCHAAPLCQ
jgi:hypothetical protein